MAYDISDIDISGMESEIGYAESDLAGDVGAFKARKIRHLSQRIARKEARQAAKEQVQALKAALHGSPLGAPQVTQDEGGKLYELPLPLGSLTLAKTGVAQTYTVRPQAKAFRVERLICDDSSPTPALQLIFVDDIKLENQSQLVTSGSLLGSYFGPTVFQTPFKGMTIQGGLDAQVVAHNGDTAADRSVNFAFYGNTYRG